MFECACARFTPKMDEVKKEIQDDWQNREFIEVISEGIKKIAEFLNDFGM